MRKKGNRKKVMLVCGSGIVTSSIIMPTVEDVLDSIGIKYKIIKGSVGELKAGGKSLDIDAVISTLEVDASLVNCPVVMARELISGQASPDLVEKIRQALTA